MTEEIEANEVAAEMEWCTKPEGSEQHHGQEGHHPKHDGFASRPAGLVEPHKPLNDPPADQQIQHRGPSDFVKPGIGGEHPNAASIDDLVWVEIEGVGQPLNRRVVLDRTGSDTERIQADIKYHDLADHGGNGNP